MQNRYVGDIGDYLKFGILRAQSPGHRLGVAWWLHPDENYKRDGRHIGNLQQPDRWRHFDPELFDALASIVAGNRRDVRALEAANLLTGALFASELIPTGDHRVCGGKRGANGSPGPQIASPMLTSCSWTLTTASNLRGLARARSRARASCSASYWNSRYRGGA